MKLKTSSLLIAATLMGAAVMPAQADNDAMVNLLKVLRDKGTISDSDYNALVSAAKEDAKATAEVKKVAKSMPKIHTKGKIKIESPDGHWSFQPIGRVMWDAINVNSDNSTNNEFRGTELRRARLGFEGKVYDWGYKFEGDFAKGNTAIKDAFVSYGTKFGDTKFKTKIGQSQIAFGFNTAASSKYMTFMDRPWYADSALSPARESGIAAKLSGHRWSLASSLTIGEFGGGVTDEDIDGTTFAVRGTVMPYHADKHHLFQVGAGYRGVSSNKNGFSYSQHLTAHKDNNKLKLSNPITTINFDGIDTYEFDAVGVYGRFHTLAEYNHFKAKSKAINNDVKIRSYSIEAGVFLTDDSMKLKHGLWSGITPKSSMGAWQVAARYESMNIDDSVAGDDEAKKWTIGLNYYVNKNIRLMLDYDKVTSWKQNGLNYTNNAKPSAVKFRAQAKW